MNYFLNVLCPIRKIKKAYFFHNIFSSSKRGGSGLYIVDLAIMFLVKTLTKK